MIGRLVWRNIWRNKRRAFITMASVLFAVLLAIVMRSLQQGAFEQLIRNVVSFHSGWIQVHRAGYWDEQTIDHSFALDSNVTRAIRQDARVKVVLPRLESFVLATGTGDTKGCLCVGTDPTGEDQLTGLRSRVVEGRYFTVDDRGALVAAGLAKKLSLHVGDTVVMLSQGYQGVQAAAKYPVIGIVSFASPPLNASTLFLPLPAMQDFLGADGRVTALALSLSDERELYEIDSSLQHTLGSSYEVMTWETLMPEIKTHMEADGMFYWIMIGILYCVIAFGIFGTALMMMNERTYELGMLVAVGMKRRAIAMMLFGETLATSLLGALAGAIVSLPVVWFMHDHPIRFTGRIAEVYAQFGFEPVMPTTVELRIFTEQASIVFVVSILIGLYPLFKARRIDPVLSMKR
ncbi:MAG: ABC transporter permease [Bacteroidetes bacterium]|nr:ABC transporter permease [Bacteroidota bacterium]